MEEKKVEEQKPSYEDLENRVKELELQLHGYMNLNNELYKKLMSSDLQNMFKRLDYLFKVVSHDNVFSAQFTTDCIEEIEQLLTLPKEKSEDKE